MMKLLFVISLLILLLLHATYYVRATQITCSKKVEGEKSPGEKMHRSNASGKKTLRLQQGISLEVDVYTEKECQISISNCRYSDDGYVGDVLAIFLCGDPVGKFTTTAEPGNGQNWNEFKSSGEINNGKMISMNANSKCRLSVVGENVDEHGVEIDYIVLDVVYDYTSYATQCPIQTFGATESECNEIVEGEKSPGEKMQRSNASGKKTLRLKQGMSLEVDVHSTKECQISISNCRYSDDGYVGDMLAFFLCGDPVGRFTTTAESGNGENWNEFKSSGEINNGKIISMNANSKCRLSVLGEEVDEHGVEIDYIVLNFVYDYTSNIAQCPAIQTTGPTECSEIVEGEKSPGEYVQRSNASGEKTLRLKQGKSLEVDVSTMKHCQIGISDFRYSDDGYVGDVLAFFLCGDPVGNFTTTAEPGNGQNWNEFKSSSEINNGKMISMNANSKCRLSVVGEKVDEHGVEIDYIALNIVCDETILNAAQCPISTTGATVLKCSEIVEGEKSQGEYIYRSNASGKKTLKLKQGMSLEVDVHAMEECQIGISDLHYSDDGYIGDVLAFSLCGDPFGNFETTAELGNGEDWNEFKSSGKINNGKMISMKANSKCRLSVVGEKIDEHGVEIDYIVLSIVYNYTSNNVDQCPIEINSVSLDNPLDTPSESSISQNDARIDPPTIDDLIQNGAKNSTESSGLSDHARAVIGIVCGIVGIVIAVPSCIFATYNIYKCISTE